MLIFLAHWPDGWAFTEKPQRFFGLRQGFDSVDLTMGSTAEESAFDTRSCNRAGVFLPSDGIPEAG